MLVKESRHVGAASNGARQILSGMAAIISTTYFAPCFTITAEAQTCNSSLPRLYRNQLNIHTQHSLSSCMYASTTYNPETYQGVSSTTILYKRLLISKSNGFVGNFEIRSVVDAVIMLNTFLVFLLFTRLLSILLSHSIAPFSILLRHTSLFPNQCILN